MNLLKKFLFLFYIFLSSCQPVPKYIQLAEQQMFSFAKEVQTTDQLQLIGFGGGFQDQINHFSLTFESPFYPTVDEARNFYFHIASRFLDRVNQNEKLYPYLSNYPFSMENLNLLILFADSLNHVTGVSIGEKYGKCYKRNFIYYVGYNPDSGKSELIHIESYQRALGILEHQENLRNTSYADE